MESPMDAMLLGKGAVGAGAGNAMRGSQTRSARTSRNRRRIFIAGSFQGVAPVVGQTFLAQPPSQTGRSASSLLDWGASAVPTQRGAHFATAASSQVTERPTP